jgi:hypothetical protein
VWSGLIQFNTQNGSLLPPPAAAGAAGAAGGAGGAAGVTAPTTVDLPARLQVRGNAQTRLSFKV